MKHLEIFWVGCFLWLFSEFCTTYNLINTIKGPYMFLKAWKTQLVLILSWQIGRNIFKMLRMWKTVKPCLSDKTSNNKRITSIEKGISDVKELVKVFNEYFSNIFFSINMNYTLKRKYNKYSSSFDIYLTKWGKNEKYEFYIY